MRKIIVNASALRSSGALTILMQFISEIPNDENTYYLFIHKTVVISESKKNLILIRVDKTSFFSRFMWDFIGLRKWLERNKITPDITISLQNTNFKVNSDCPNFVYYHQSIPFYDYKWSIFSKNEQNLWFYKNIYPFFVKLFINKKTHFFVQLNYIKELFSKRYHIDKDRIHVVFPKVTFSIDEVCCKDMKLNSENLKLFYPATNESYKNHILLFEVLKKIDSKTNRTIDLYLTINENEFKFNSKLKKININYIGRIPFSNILWLYNNVDCLIFPSYMETLGLPLVEAASYGLKIFVSDLPYAREVLKGYNGAFFAKYNSIEEWSELILRESNINSTEKYDKLNISDRNGWNMFFLTINK